MPPWSPVDELCRKQPPASRPHGWTFAAFLYLSLATIFAHALVPSGSPLNRASGSAFDAFTWDVSLGPRRAAPPEKDKKGHNPWSDGSGGAGGELIAPLRQSSAPPPILRRSEPPAVSAAPAFHPARLIAPTLQARAPPAA